MSNYNFPVGLYEDNITYVNAYSLFAFFMRKEQTDAFFQYLYFRIEEDYKKRKKGDSGFIQVLKNDNIYSSLIDINYNFLIEVFAEWIEKYASNKNVVVDYKKYKYFTKDKDGNDIERVGKFRNCTVEFSVKELVQFDYSYSGWLISNRFKKMLRFKLIQVFLNNLLGGYTYVRNYKWPMKAMVTNLYLLKEEKRYVKFVGVSFLNKNLSQHLGKAKVKKLLEMANNYEVVISTSKGVNNHIKKLNLEEKDVIFYDNFDLKSIEENRDSSDKIYHLFEEKIDDETQEDDEIE